MTDKKDGPPKGPDRAVPDSAGAKRPFATLDLKATEVKQEAAKAAADAKASSAAPSAGTSTPPPAGSQGETAAKVAAASASLKSGAEKPATAATPSAASTPGSTPYGQPGGAKAGASAAGAAAAAAAARPASTPASPSAMQGGQGRNVLSHLAAGVLGGSIVLFAGQWIGLGGSDSGQNRPAANAPDMASRLNTLDILVRDKIAAQSKADGSNRQALEASVKQIDTLKQQLAGLGTVQAQLAADTTALKEAQAKFGSTSEPGERLRKLEEQIATMANVAVTDPQNAGRLPQLAQLTGKIADLEQQLATRLEALRKDVGQDVGTRVGAVAEVSETARSGTQRLDREVAGVNAEMARLGQRIDQFKAGSDRTETTVAGLQEAERRLQTSLDALKAETDKELKGVARPADIARAVTPVTDKMAALESSMQGVVTAEEARKVNAERIVLSLELGNLKRAMERGEKYHAELAEVKRIAGTRLDVAALERYQSTGVLTVPELARSFRSVVNTMLDADALPEGASMVDRLLTGAKTIVRVRRTGHADDDTSTEAIIARMETALADNRLGDVLAESKKLSPRALAPAQEWLRKVDARQSVDTALVAIDAALKSSLGGAAPAAKGTKP